MARNALSEALAKLLIAKTFGIPHWINADNKVEGRFPHRANTAGINKQLNGAIIYMFSKFCSHASDGVLVADISLQHFMSVSPVALTFSSILKFLLLGSNVYS